jgi:hypothetical protein
VLHAAVILLAVLGCVAVGAGDVGDGVASAIGPGSADRAGGQTWSLYQAGLAMFTVVVLTVHLQLALCVDQWTWMHHASMWGSVGLWFVFLLAFGAFPVRWSADLYDLMAGVAGNSLSFWLLVLVVPLICVLPSFFWRAAVRHVRPALYQRVQEVAARERRGEVDLTEPAVPTAQLVRQEMERAVSRAGQLVARSAQRLMPSAAGAAGPTAADLLVVGGGGGGVVGGVGARPTGARHRRLRSHTGYVPAYDPKSRTYDLDRMYSATGGSAGGGGAGGAFSEVGGEAALRMGGGGGGSPGSRGSPGGFGGGRVPTHAATSPGELGRASWGAGEGAGFGFGRAGQGAAAAGARPGAAGAAATGAGGDDATAAGGSFVDDNPYATTNPVMEHLEQAFARDPRRHRRAASLSLLSLPAAAAAVLPRLRSSASIRSLLPPLLRTPSARSASTTGGGGGGGGSRALSPAGTVVAGSGLLSPRSVAGSAGGGGTGGGGSGAPSPPAPPLSLSPAGSAPPPLALGAVPGVVEEAPVPPPQQQQPLPARLSALPEASAATEAAPSSGGGAVAGGRAASAGAGVTSRALPDLLRATGSERESREEEEEGKEQ